MINSWLKDLIVPTFKIRNKDFLFKISINTTKNSIFQLFVFFFSISLISFFLDFFSHQITAFLVFYLTVAGLSLFNFFCDFFSIGFVSDSIFFAMITTSMNISVFPYCLRRFFFRFDKNSNKARDLFTPFQFCNVFTFYTVSNAYLHNMYC